MCRCGALLDVARVKMTGDMITYFTHFTSAAKGHFHHALEDVSPVFDSEVTNNDLYVCRQKKRQCGRAKESVVFIKVN